MAPFVQARVAAPARAPVNPKHHPRSAAGRRPPECGSASDMGQARGHSHTPGRASVPRRRKACMCGLRRASSSIVTMTVPSEQRTISSACRGASTSNRGWGGHAGSAAPCSPCRFARTRCHGLGVRGQCHRPPERARMSLDHSCWTLPMEPHVTVMFEACRCTTFHEPDCSDRTNVRRPSARSISR